MATNRAHTSYKQVVELFNKEVQKKLDESEIHQRERLTKLQLANGATLSPEEIEETLSKARRQVELLSIQFFNNQINQVKEERAPIAESKVSAKTTASCLALPQELPKNR